MTRRPNISIWPSICLVTAGEHAALTQRLLGVEAARRHLLVVPELDRLQGWNRAHPQTRAELLSSLRSIALDLPLPPARRELVATMRRVARGERLSLIGGDR